MPQVPIPDGPYAWIALGALAFIFFLRVMHGHSSNKSKKQKQQAVNTSNATTAEEEETSIKAPAPPEPKTKIGEGDIKCICFRKIKGVPVVDFNTIDNAIGEMYQIDPSCPISGSGYIVKENDNREIVDFDPREVAYDLSKCPEMAYFAIDWRIVKEVYFVATNWLKSINFWLMGGMIAGVILVSLVFFGG